MFTQILSAIQGAEDAIKTAETGEPVRIDVSIRGIGRVEGRRIDLVALTINKR